MGEDLSFWKKCLESEGQQGKDIPLNIPALPGTWYFSPAAGRQAPGSLVAPAACISWARWQSAKKSLTGSPLLALVHQKLSRAQKFCLVSQQKHGSRALLGTKSKNLKEGPVKVEQVLALQAWGPKFSPQHLHKVSQVWWRTVSS